MVKTILNMEGPQLDGPYSTKAALGQCASGGGWQGMSIKDILEKVDLFNFTTLVDDDGQKKKDTKEYPKMIPDLKIVKPEPCVSRNTSAFLGPKIWKKPLSFKSGETLDNNGGSMDAASAECSLMNIEEFLTENNLDFSGRFSPPEEEDEGEQRESTPTIDMDDYRNPDSVTSLGLTMDTEQPVSPPTAPKYALGLKRKLQGGTPSSPIPSSSSWPLVPSSVPQLSDKSKNELPKGENQFLYAESKRAKLEREKRQREELRRREDDQVEFSAEELALATIPGANFDPSRRQFSMDELKPQPIIRKRGKAYVSSDRKDDKYWEKRVKNNVAARRSREARRLKENQISLRTAYLEQQNSALKASLTTLNGKNDKLNFEKKILMEKLKRFESMSPFVDELRNVM